MNGWETKGAEEKRRDVVVWDDAFKRYIDPTGVLEGNWCLKSERWDDFVFE
jgi:hypothetical protein